MSLSYGAISEIPISGQEVVFGAPFVYDHDPALAKDVVQEWPEQAVVEVFNPVRLF